MKDMLIKDVFLDNSRTDIYIDDTGRIAEIGHLKDDAATVIEGQGDIAVPGLVNTHTHAAMSLLRGYADDMPLQDWLTTKIWPLEAHLTAEDVYHGTRLACLEMIRSGTIAFNDMYFFMEEAARAVDGMGMKAVLAHGFIDLSDPDKREEEIKKTEEFCGAVKEMNNPRIAAAVGPHAVYTVSQEGLQWLAGYAGEENIGIHVHLSETEKEVADCRSQTGMRPPELLDRCGCLTPRTVTAHCCWLDRSECKRLGARGVYVSYNPVSNMKLAVNRAMPYHWLKEEGVNVSLGTDGCASNNNLDLCEEMKFAALLQKFFWNSQTLLTAPEVLGMATTAGARALSLGAGEIAVGAPADIVLIDRSAPCNTPLHNTESNLVYACHGDAVQTVICNGNVLMLERTVPGEEEILAEAARTAEDLVRRAEDAGDL